MYTICEVKNSNELRISPPIFCILSHYNGKICYSVPNLNSPNSKNIICYVKNMELGNNWSLKFTKTFAFWNSSNQEFELKKGLFRIWSLYLKSKCLYPMKAFIIVPAGIISMPVANKGPSANTS